MHGAAWVWSRPHDDLTLVWTMGEWDYPINHGFAHRYMSPEQLGKYLHAKDRPRCAILFPENTFRKHRNYFPDDGEYFRSNQLLLVVYPPAVKNP